MNGVAITRSKFARKENKDFDFGEVIAVILIRHLNRMSIEK